MYYVYVIKSVKWKTRYVGHTENVPARVQEHNQGKCRYTKGRKPWILILQEHYTTKSEAVRRERFLKTGRGRQYLDCILKE